MALYLTALDGPHKDRSFALRRGFVVGRNEGDLVCKNDAKLSSRHAYVEGNEKDELFLFDNKSKNGLRVNGKAENKIKLTVGTQILIGTYIYQVVDQKVEPPKPPEKKARFWHEILVDYARECFPHVENVPKGIVSLHPAVVLDIVRGGQAETRWVLGYGPRRIGSASIDLPIYEPNAPKVCFEILPTPDGISFKTNHPDLVKLNGQSSESGILRLGDLIRIAETEIEVDFIE
jgi:hypothetical protein